MVDVEPFPRLKLMKLYYMTMQEYKNLPDSYAYKHASEELTKYRMEVVDSTKNVKEIEHTIAAGMIEDLILAAHNELKFIKILSK